MSLPTIDTNYFTTFLVDLLNIPSPTGFAEPTIEFVEKKLSKYKQLQLSRTRKGALVAKWQVKLNLRRLDFYIEGREGLHCCCSS